MIQGSPKKGTEDKQTKWIFIFDVFASPSFIKITQGNSRLSRGVADGLVCMDICHSKERTGMDGRFPLWFLTIF
jgi:hypothetical protein